MAKNNSIKIILTYVIGYFLLNIAVLAYLLTSGKTQLEIFEGALANFLFYLTMGVLTIHLGYSYLKEQLHDAKQRWKTLLFNVLLGFGLIFGTSMLVSIIYTLIDFTQPAQNQSAWEEIISSGTFGVIATVASSVLFAPIVEELVFRYAGFSILRKFNISEKAYPYVAVIVTSFLFGFIHVMGDNLLQILFYSGLGAVLGFTYYRSKNILVPIAVHMIWNLMGVLTMILA